MEKLTTVLITCPECDSQFYLKFDKDLVAEHDDLLCPFCGEIVYEDVRYEEDMEDSSNDDW